MPRLFRQSPLNAIWEGSGNVICLDVLRAMQRDPTSFDIFLAEVTRAQGHEPRLEALVTDFLNELQVCSEDPVLLQRHARRLVDKMAIMLQASVLLQYGDADVATAFCASRLPPLAREPSGVSEGLAYVTSIQGWNYGAMACDAGGPTVEQALLDRLMACRAE